MKEVIFHPDSFSTTIHDGPLPEPIGDQILIRVKVAASNPKDWEHPTALKKSLNSGDDAAGVIEAMGSRAAACGEFHVGDRVAGFHPMASPSGTYAEATLVPYHTVFHIPDNISFEEAATVPLTTMTAAISLFRRQSLPPPWTPLPSKSRPIPLIIYNASSSLGLSAVKLARASNLHPIIAIAGHGTDNMKPLLDSSLGDSVVSYLAGPEQMKRDVAAALQGFPLPRHALDAYSSNQSWVHVAQMLDPEGGRLSVVSGAKRYDEPEIPKNVEIVYTYVGTAHDGAYKDSMPCQPLNKDDVRADREFAYVMFRYVSRMLADGRYSGHPFEIVPGGLQGVEDGLRKLKAGQAGGKKFVYQIQGKV